MRISSEAFHATCTQQPVLGLGMPRRLRGAHRCRPGSRVAQLIEVSRALVGATIKQASGQLGPRDSLPLRNLIEGPVPSRMQWARARWLSSATRVAGWGEHDRVELATAVGRPGVEHVVGHRDQVTDVHPTVVEVEAQPGQSRTAARVAARGVEAGPGAVRGIADQAIPSETMWCGHGGAVGTHTGAR